jgi:hypothetical protein
VRRFLVIDQIHEGIQKPKLGIGIFTGTGHTRTLHQSIVSPKNQSKSIQQKNFFFHAGKNNRMYWNAGLKFGQEQGGHVVGASHLLSALSPSR